MLKYHRNFILCGEVDYFCLLCHESFESAEEVEKHIRWEKHRKTMKTLSAVPQGFWNGAVCKFENVYYCYACNIVKPNLRSMNEHVKENKCKPVSEKAENSKVPETKKEGFIKRDLGFVMVSNCAVTKREWHGIVSNQCLFCDVPVVDFEKHIALTAHMLKFVQAELKTEENGWIYRKINQNTYYCYKCKKTVPQESMPEHPNSDDHSAKIVEKKDAADKLLYKIDKENSLATCNLCNKIIVWSSIAMVKHRIEHVDKKEWTCSNNENYQEDQLLFFQDKGKLRAELKQFGKDNFIKLNEGGGKGFCSLCNTYISAHIRNFRQHVNGNRHINHLELKGLVKKSKKTEKPRHKTKTIRQLLNDQELVFMKEKTLFFYRAVRPLSIKMFNFLMMSHPDVHGGKIVCYLCDLVIDKLESHLESGHREKLMTIPVITTLKAEFIREIRSGLYHCGICNIPFAGWSVMEKHLTTWKHRFAMIESVEYVEEIVEAATNETGNHFDDDDCGCSCGNCISRMMPDFLD